MPGGSQVQVSTVDAMLSRLYGILLNRIILTRSMFMLCQRYGFHITPNHFYQPVPDTSELKDDLWRKHSELIGIDLRETSQLELLRLFASKFKNEYEQFPRTPTATPYEYYMANSAFVSVDGEILYSMIRHFKPRRIFEIGSGYSTYLSAQAVQKNAEEDRGYECELVAFEPYPDEILKAGFPGLSRLVRKKIQDVPVSEFDKLAQNDILFIDSSHVLKTGSDVHLEYLEILPRLNKGVIVHTHDIFLPQEYPKEWVLGRRLFWTEQYVLQAFLAFNDSFEVLWAGNYMNLKHPDELKKAFSSYKRNQTLPGSFWTRRKK